MKLIQSKRVEDSIPFDILEWNSNQNFLSKQSWIMQLINLPGPSLTRTNFSSFQAFFFCLPLSSYTGLHIQVFHVIPRKSAPFWWMPIYGLSCIRTVQYYPFLDCTKNHPLLMTLTKTTKQWLTNTERPSLSISLTSPP